ncbi:hypothetical protein LP419_22285 [Massilia sp. H-1]|nr:hypothetical protein LP419_22285 [Massilia sp. H-1]
MLRHAQLAHGDGGLSIAAAWIIGAFYYQAAYPLQTKAIWMIAAGALLA